MAFKMINIVLKVIKEQSATGALHMLLCKHIYYTNKYTDVYVSTYGGGQGRIDRERMTGMIIYKYLW